MNFNNFEHAFIFSKHKPKIKPCYCYHSIFHAIAVIDLANRDCAYLRYLKSRILQVNLTWVFFNKYFQEHTCSVSFTSNFKEQQWDMFFISWCDLHLMAWNLIAPKNDLQWSRLPAFAHSPTLIVKLERSSMEKLKFNHFDGVFGMFLFFEIPTNTWPIYFAKLCS